MKKKYCCDAMLTQANDHRIAIEIMLAEKYEYFKINLKINLYFSQ